MPKITLGSAAKKAAEYDKQTAEIEEQIFSRIGAKHVKQLDIATVLGKTRSAISYSLKDIDRMRFGDIRRLCDMAGIVEISIQVPVSPMAKLVKHKKNYSFLPEHSQTLYKIFLYAFLYHPLYNSITAA